MPEVTFTIAWPDGQHEDCYSPSTVVFEHFEPGASYALSDFLARARAALTRASERVAAKYGYECSSARDQLARLHDAAQRFAADEPRPVRVLAMSIALKPP